MNDPRGSYIQGHASFKEKYKEIHDTEGEKAAWSEAEMGGIWSQVKERLISRRQKIEEKER